MEKMKRNDKPATRINGCKMTPSPQKALVTAADDSRAKKAKKCGGEIPSARWRRFHPREQGLSASHKTRIVVPSMAMQVRVPVRHAPVSMLIRLCLISGCGTGVWP